MLKAAWGQPADQSLARQVVERVTSQKIRESPTRGVPVAGKVRASGHANFLHGAKMLEVRDRNWIRRTTFEPLGGVDLVPNLSPLQQRVDPVFPEAVIHESNRERASDPQGLE